MAVSRSLDEDQQLGSTVDGHPHRVRTPPLLPIFHPPIELASMRPRGRLDLDGSAGIIARNPATDRARRGTVGRSFRSSEPSTPRDLALPNVAILEQLVARVVEAGKDQSWGDVVTILATTALRISEVSGLRVGDVDLVRGLIHVLRQTYPGRGAHASRV
jgi:integrase